jgi:hypothetical protein
LLNHQQLFNANKCEIIDKCIPSILSKNYSVAISSSPTFILKCKEHLSEVKLLLKDLWKSRKPKLTTKLWSRGALKAQTKKKLNECISFRFIVFARIALRCTFVCHLPYFFLFHCHFDFLEVKICQCLLLLLQTVTMTFGDIIELAWLKGAGGERDLSK